MLRRSLYCRNSATTAGARFALLPTRPFATLTLGSPTDRAKPTMSKYKKALTVVIARMGIGTAEVNERGNFSAVSPALCQMLGFSDDELLATPAGRFFEFPDLKADAWP